MSKFKPVKYEVDGCLLEVFGVLFEADSPQEAIRRYRQGETVFWDGWRGSFCGVLRDEKNDTTLLFNDHIGSKMLFYAQTEHGFFYGRDLRELSQLTGLRTPDEVFIRALEHNIGEREAKQPISCLTHLSRLWIRIVEVFAHSGELATLPREYKCFSHD